MASTTGCRHPHAVLRVLRDGKPYKDIAIGVAQCTTFGASAQQADVVLVHPSSSDPHAAVTVDSDGELQISDLDSESGTCVNGVKLVPNEAHMLKDDDVITFGKSTRQYIVSLHGIQQQSRKRKVTVAESDSVRASHILVKHRDSRRPSSWKQEVVTRTPKEALDIITGLRQRIVQCDDEFEAIAKEHSECSSHSRGGDLGRFRLGKMQPSFEKAAFALQVGELSEPVRTDSGIHIIKRTG